MAAGRHAPGGVHPAGRTRAARRGKHGRTAWIARDEPRAVAICPYNT